MSTEPEISVKEFKISLPLIQKISDLKPNDPESALIEFVTTNGLPCDLPCENSIALYLYFHQMLVPYYSILSKISTDEVKQVLMQALKEKFQLLSDIENKHYNFESIGKELTGKVTNKPDSSEVAKIPIELGDGATSKGKFVLNKKLLTLGQKGLGRLDIYVKAHIIKSIILYLGIDELAAFTQNFKVMEDDLIKVSETAEKEKLNQEKYNYMVNLFANEKKKSEWYQTLIQLKKIINIIPKC